MAVSAVAGLATAIGAAAAAGGITSALVFFGLKSWAAFAAWAALGAGLSMVSRALAPKPNLGAQLRGITQTTREPAGTRKLVYGKMRVGGQVVFIAHSGDDNKYLHMAIAFASHEIESYEEIWFNDKKVWTATGGFQSDWGTYVTIDRKYGTAAQSASTQLVNANTQWTTDHKLSGIAYVAFKLEWDADKFPQGVPNITAVVKGKKVYDPRDSNQSATNASTWTFSQNPALCLRDYLIDDKYGLGEDRTLIDSTSLTAAANLCDETQNSGSDIYSTSGQKRYKLDGVIDAANNIKDNIEQMLSAMGGNLTYSGGKYFIKGAEYVAPTVTFDEADCVSDVSVQTKQSRRGVYNGVKGIFVAENKNWKVLDYPAQISSTYQAQDGDPIYLDMPLPFVTNENQAQLLAKLALLRSRQQTVVQVTVNLKGLQVKVGDTVNLTNTRLGYSSKIFEVIEYSLNAPENGPIGVDLTLIETGSAVYDWATSDEQDFLSGGELDLYDGRTVANVTSLTHSVIGLKGPDGKNITTVDFSWTGPTDAFIEYYVVTLEKDSDGNIFEYQTREPRLRVPNLDIGSAYEVIVKGENLIGVQSSGTTLNIASLAGDTTAPAVPTNATATGGIRQITVEWTEAADEDLALTLIYYNDTNNLSTATTSKTRGEEFVYTLADNETSPKTKYFWLSSIDYSGNESVKTASFTGTSVRTKENDIEDGAATETKIGDGAVTEVKIEDGAVTADKITVNELSAISADVGSITAGTLQAGGSNAIPDANDSPSGSETGAFIDLDNGKFVFGDANKHLLYDGSTLVVKGELEADILDVIDANIRGQLTANAISAGVVTVESLSAGVFAEFDDRYGTSGGFYVTDTDEFFDGNSTKYVTVGTVAHSTDDIYFECRLNHSWSWPRNDTGDKLKANVSFEYSTDNSTWTTVPSSTTQVATATGVVAQYATLYSIAEDITYTMAGSSLTAGNYYFRVKIVAQNSTNAFQLAAFSGSGVPIAFEVQESSGLSAAGGNADTLDGLDSTQFLRSDASDTLTGDLTITGNLTVQGTQTTLDTATLQVEDKNITLNYGTGDTSGSANGAGITIQDAVSASSDAFMNWNATHDIFQFSHSATFGYTTIDPDSFLGTSGGFGHIADGSGWGARGLYIQGGGTGDAAAIGHNGSSLYFGIQNGSTANSMATWLTVTPAKVATFAAQVNVTGHGNSSQWNTAYGWGDHSTAGYLTAEADTLASVTGRGATTTNAISTGAITSSGLIRGNGLSTDGNAKLYTWRAVDNTSTSSGWVWIARVTAAQSSRFIIELAGRSTSYGDGAFPAMGHIVGQLNNDDNYDIVFYNAKSGSSEVVTDVGQVDVNAVSTDIYVQVGNFSEVTATAHISDGSIETKSTLYTTQPANYTSVTEYTVWNSGNDSSLTLDYITDNGATTTNAISTGAITSSGQFTTAGSITAGNASTTLGYYVGPTQVINGSRVATFAQVVSSGSLSGTGVHFANTHSKTKIRLLGSTDNAHNIGTESYNNTYGPNSWTGGTIGHRFYGTPTSLIARLGTGGASGDLNSEFYGSVKIDQTSSSLIDHLVLENDNAGGAGGAIAFKQLGGTKAKLKSYFGSNQWTFAIDTEDTTDAFEIYDDGTVNISGALESGGTTILSSTRRFYASDGTSVKAAYSFDGDSGTGISRTAAGRIDFLSSGAVKAYIKTGTSNPISPTMYVDGRTEINGVVTWTGGAQPMPTLHTVGAITQRKTTRSLQGTHLQGCLKPLAAL